MASVKRTLVAMLVLVGCGDHTPIQQDVDTTEVETVATSTPVDRRALTSLPPEERLFYIDATASDHFGGLLTPGARVDILAFLDDVETTKDEEPPGPVAQLILQNVTVLDVSAHDRGHKSRIGFGLTPDEVQMLALMERSADLVLLARNPEDVAVRPVERMTFRRGLEDLEVMQQRRQLRTRGSDSSNVAASDLVSRIPPEERGVVVTTGLPGDSLRDGDRLDILGVFEPNGETSMPIALTLLQSVKVLNVLEGGKAVVALTVEEAETLGLAERRGELEFVARSPFDEDVSYLTKKTLREVVQDLEVIQEKRTIRSTKRPRKKKRAAGIEILRGDGLAPLAPPDSTTESYAHYGVNPSYDPEVDPQSTFAVDVDTASYTNVRRFIREGGAVPPEAVRVEEFVNYFPYDYPTPEHGPFGVSTEMAPSPFSTAPETKLLRIGVQGSTIAADERKPVHLVFLVDVSGSMRDADRLPLAKQALRYLVHNLRETDTVAIATYAGETMLALEPTPASHRRHILKAIDMLRAEGGTAMGDGLGLAYRLAAKTHRPNHESRVVVMSDGDANIGDTSWDEMLAKVESEVERGVTMTTVGFGRGNFQDTTMEQLANRGNGNYHYVDSLAEAHRIFGRQLDGTLRTIARDVKIQVEFNPNTVSRYRLIGYENRALADRDFRNDDADAGEIGAGHQVTALYEVTLTGDRSERVATVRIRHKPVGGDEALESAFEVERSTMRPSLAQSSADLRFAASAAAFAEILRESPAAAGVTLDWIAEIALGAVDGRPERNELVELIDELR